MRFVDSGAYVKKLASSSVSSDANTGVWFYKWGPIGIVQARFVTVKSGGSRLGTLSDGYSPLNSALGYLYIQGVNGETGQIVVDRDGTINAWLSQSSDYCSGQVAFAISNP